VARKVFLAMLDEAGFLKPLSKRLKEIRLATAHDEQGGMSAPRRVLCPPVPTAIDFNRLDSTPEASQVTIPHGRGDLPQCVRDCL